MNRRLLKHIAYISNDDVLLTREGLGIRLSVEELRTALSERGQLVYSLSLDLQISDPFRFTVLVLRRDLHIPRCGMDSLVGLLILGARKTRYGRF